MLIIPAIDLRAGKCVRLVEGKLDRETIYSNDPAAVARVWQGSGARMLHVVDLDGAFAGSPRNLETIQEILKAVTIPVQVGGGIRDLATVERLLQMGVARVILGTVAIQNPALVAEACKRFGSEHIVVGIDARDGKVAIEGWGLTAEKDALELADEISRMGITRVVFTDISRDGTLKGPNTEAIRNLAMSSKLKVIASGGVSTIQDIVALHELAPLGVEGVIVGKALYAGTVSIDEALALER
ncbi:1-(5-phosphoribosyl)-5-[(5-phosphoribosylamino)methylideneamino]imidazole-4-carboxamide isomerase [Desulfallas thermosapovorans]|uniref:1-(5-phosphoribosyl)-5-[(5-phosphoribosylamino)methylideneamino] imidazole-4-carboxamide isomerase n=1 Tax=Desulfallas thermosapovorans DSM 6562 TaxID=1121431 RepID=A0A5S4ZTR2_9FIRM|nr:1-(5-phosphoribosyl)-5-[(5-phosphoribosylamino)methylideneamino]imidazole-4-carboxamide isomerase [Desulfallas thermosapovorans]TYO96264.1 1-(5-phosphoribosyl)-5-[(5-phosphoribosylamino)methylideneamino] imidazole-4-carboxamide isomerase [Desulfallas thermosapovorans DSM 6562]